MIFGHIINKLTLLCIVQSFLTVSAHAATVNIETCPEDPNFSCITSIENIEVFGVYYDVTIHKDSFNNLFPSPEVDITYWGNDLWAKEAVKSITNALNSLDPIPSRDDTLFVDSFFGDVLHLPFEFSESRSGFFNSYCVQLVNIGPHFWGGCGIWNPTHIVALATFSQKTVPSLNTIPLNSYLLLLLK